MERMEEKLLRIMKGIGIYIHKRLYKQYLKKSAQYYASSPQFTNISIFSSLSNKD